MLGAFISWPQTFWTCVCTFCLSTRCCGNGLWKPSVEDQVCWRQAERKQAWDPRDLISGVWKQRPGEKNGPLARRPINSLWIEDFGLWTQSGQMGAIFKEEARRLLRASESGFPPALGYFLKAAYGCSDCKRQARPEGKSSRAHQDFLEDVTAGCSLTPESQSPIASSVPGSASS